MEFYNQYKHPKWQKARLKILERDNYTCCNCGEKENTLHVHHLLYKKNTMIWEYEDDYLMTLCDDCHHDWHKINDNIKEELCLPTDFLKDRLDFIEMINSLSIKNMLLAKKHIMKLLHKQ